MKRRWFLAGLAALILYVLAEAAASAYVLARLSGTHEVLVAPDGARFPVLKPAEPGASVPAGAAWVIGAAGATLGHVVSYGLPGGGVVVCRHLPWGVACREGWAAIWTGPVARK